MSLSDEEIRQFREQAAQSGRRIDELPGRVTHAITQLSVVAERLEATIAKAQEMMVEVLAGRLHHGQAAQLIENLRMAARGCHAAASEVAAVGDALEAHAKLLRAVVERIRGGAA